MDEIFVNIARTVITPIAAVAAYPGKLQHSYTEAWTRRSDVDLGQRTLVLAVVAVASRRPGLLVTTPLISLASLSVVRARV